MKKILSCIVISMGFLQLTGCATQKNIPLQESFWQNKKNNVTVATTKADKPQLYQMGNQGLLEYAINNAINNTLEKHLATLDTSWYQQMPENFSARLKQRNIASHIYLSQLNSDEKNYTNVIDSDKLLVIKLNALGAKRNYFGFVPTGAPQAYCAMSAELIDTKTHQVLWRYSTSVTQDVQGTWDQPPNYPNLSNAIRVAANSAREELVDSFFSGH